VEFNELRTVRHFSPAQKMPVYLIDGMEALLYSKWSDQEYDVGGQAFVLEMVDLRIEYNVYLRRSNEKLSGSLF